MKRLVRHYELFSIVPVVVRICLKCDVSFKSHGDRLCEKCNRENTAMTNGPSRKWNNTGGRVVKKEPG